VKESIASANNGSTEGETPIDSSEQAPQNDEQDAEELT
jgi:hypothetical protein